MDKQSKYSLGFTTGAAMLHESVIVAESYNALRSWSDVRSKVLEDNSFQARTLSTLKKRYGEVSKRLKHLSDVEIELLADNNVFYTKPLVWLSICRHYSLIKDFALEVILPQYESAKFLIALEDFDAFFNRKAEWHQNLDEASKLTKVKVRQVLFLMLKECNLIDNNNEIQYQQLGERLRYVISENSTEDLYLFPGVR